MSKIIFWNVDTQKDFMDKEGALYVPGAELIKPNLQKLTLIARQNHIPIINSCDSHVVTDEEISDNPDFLHTFPEHCMVGTSGRDFIQETLPLYHHSRIYKEPIIDFTHKEFVLLKNKFDVFEGNPYSGELLDFLSPDLVVVYGVVTNICVDAAVKGIRKRGYRVIVVRDAIKELPDYSLKQIIDGWIDLDVSLIMTKDVVNLVNGMD